MNPALEWIEEQWASTNTLSVYLLFFIFVLCLTKFNKPGSTKSNLPPSPWKLPLIGNLHQIHGLPHHGLWSLASKHGPIMLLHFGRAPVLVVSSDSIVRDVMKTYDHVFSSRPKKEIPKRLLYDKDIAFAPYGEYWRQVRKICVIQLLRVKKVQAFQYVREEEVALMMEKLNEPCLSKSAVNLSEIFLSLTSSIVCRIAFGRKYDEGDDGKKFKRLIKEFAYLLVVSNVRDFIPLFAWVNYLNGLNARVEKNFRELDSFMDEVVQEHIEKRKKSEGDDQNEEDLVDVMLGIEEDSTLGIHMERDNTKAIIWDMFAAGTDTSAVVLEWAMSELIKHPHIMEEVKNEVREVCGGKLVLKGEDIEEMHNLKSVIKETLRLHPPLPLLVPRESIENVQIHGYHVPAKTTVIVNAYAIGRDPIFWEEPEQFRPKRFMKGSSSASVDFKGQDFQLIPFGAGRRGCPGIVFATSTIELALANLLNKFDWEVPNEMDGKDLDMHEHDGLTVCRKNDILLIPVKPMVQVHG